MEFDNQTHAPTLLLSNACLWVLDWLQSQNPHLPQHTRWELAPHGIEIRNNGYEKFACGTQTSKHHLLIFLPPHLDTPTLPKQQIFEFIGRFATVMAEWVLKHKRLAWWRHPAAHTFMARADELMAKWGAA